MAPLIILVPRLGGTDAEFREYHEYAKYVRVRQPMDACLHRGADGTLSERAGYHQTVRIRTLASMLP